MLAFRRCENFAQCSLTMNVQDLKNLPDCIAEWAGYQDITDLTDPNVIAKAKVNNLHYLNMLKQMDNLPQHFYVNEKGKNTFWRNKDWYGTVFLTKDVDTVHPFKDINQNDLEADVNDKQNFLVHRFSDLPEMKHYSDHLQPVHVENYQKFFNENTMKNVRDDNVDALEKRLNEMRNERDTEWKHILANTVKKPIQKPRCVRDNIQKEELISARMMELSAEENRASYIITKRIFDRFGSGAKLREAIWRPGGPMCKKIWESLQEDCPTTSPTKFYSQPVPKLDVNEKR